MSHSKPSSAQSLWAWYLRSLKEKPVVTKALTSATMSLLSNLVAQKLLERRRTLDLPRLAKFSLFGLISSPITHIWYEVCDRLFRPRAKSPTAVYERLLLDQLLYAPFINIVFYTFMSIMNGRPGDAPSTIRSQLWPTLTASWKVWPLAQLINFSFVPAHLRVLFGNFIGFLWGMYLALISQKKIK
eukprot:TRINITY_DN13634_c0_g1_i1.p1 TRINITY_DN13634_c0_g1~~TRINITY_DN13634_c0_g1_i1.p1  ORF type:complete len:186 (+),score=46.48 TRINITY_DN13634_c0_g1_i1:46-603(+)